MSAVNEAVRAIAAARGRRLVLVYHRVEPCGSDHGIIPCVEPALFRRQIETLAGLGRIVPLHELVEDRSRRRSVRLALTFDDDYRTHVHQVLPALEAVGVPATFFLSGRSLHGLGPYWFQALDDLVTTRGLADVKDGLGLPARMSPREVAVACETDPGRQRILTERAGVAGELLAPAEIRQLAGTAGMGVGFHTLHHPVLTTLPDKSLDAALTQGRSELRTLVGRPLSLFAYPHGKADARVARRTRRAGYTAAVTGRPLPVRRGDDRHLLGRWEPGPIGTDELIVKVAVRLTRPVMPTRRGGREVGRA